MKRELKKATHIANELLKMFLINGAKDVDMNIKYLDDRTEITFVHHACCYDDTFVEQLRYNLNTQRQSEVEGYYWQLVGDDENGDELHLVGAMIDEASVVIEDGDLKVHMVRNHI